MKKLVTINNPLPKLDDIVRLYRKRKKKEGNVNIENCTDSITSKELYTYRSLVTYWPRPSCQKKKCTWVNNRCIRSKISGDNLDCRRVELSANCDARKKLVGIKLLYNPGDRKFRLVGEKMLEWEHVPAEARLPRPPQAPGWAAQKNGKELLL